MTTCRGSRTSPHSSAAHPTRRASRMCGATSCIWRRAAPAYRRSTRASRYCEDLANAINSLQQSGAKYIFVANQGAASADSTLDACKIFYQKSIGADLNTLGVTYVRGGRGFSPLIQSEPSTFGINLAEGPACTPVPPHISTAYGLVCSPTSPAT